MQILCSRGIYNVPSNQFISFSILASTAQAAPETRLVLQITVDQLRGNLPWRHMDQFGKGGFCYLADKGVWYTNATYQHANTETIVGHTSLATGTVPAVHGMVGNIWFDRASHELVYNIEDPRYALLSANADVDDNNEIDPTQRVATTDGRSPRALLSSSFSDELAARYGGASKIFGVSIKDRGAVPLAGLILLIHNVSATAPIPLVMTAFFANSDVWRCLIQAFKK